MFVMANRKKCQMQESIILCYQQQTQIILHIKSGKVSAGRKYLNMVLKLKSKSQYGCLYPVC